MKKMYFETEREKNLLERLDGYNYDYHEAVVDDVIEAIREYIDYDYETSRGMTIPQAFNDDRYALEDDLHDSLWVKDGVTGNASGSYTFSTYKAEKYLAHNWDILQEALEMFGDDFNHAIERGPEYCDVTIRCYLLNEAICEALDQLSMEGLFDIDDTEDDEPEELQAAADASEK